MRFTWLLSLLISSFSYQFEICSIVVFSCIISNGWHGDYCQMHGDNHACRYGTGVGILAFIICLPLLVIAMSEDICSIKCRKYVVIAELVISGLLTLLWFVGFCYMTDAWRRSPEDAPYRTPGGHGKDNIQAAIAFSFFSILTWGGLTFFAVRRYRELLSETFQKDYDPKKNAEYCCIFMLLRCNCLARYVIEDIEV